MSESEPEAEQLALEVLTHNEIVGMVEGVLSEEELADLKGMTTEEVLGYLMSNLPERGIEDPAAFLRERMPDLHIPSDIQRAIETPHPKYRIPEKLDKEALKRAEDISIIILRRLEMLDEVIESNELPKTIAEEWDPKIAAEEMNLVVAYDGSTSIGYAVVDFAGSDEQQVIDEIGPVPTLTYIYVKPDYRGWGISKRLILSAEYTVRKHEERPQVLAVPIERNHVFASWLELEMGYKIQKFKNEEYGGGYFFKRTKPEIRPQTEQSFRDRDPLRSLFVKDLEQQTANS